MGVEVAVKGLTKSFGKQPIWADVTLTLPAGRDLRAARPVRHRQVGLPQDPGRPAQARPRRVWIEGSDLPRCSETDLYEIRKLFGVLFQDGALFGSMNIYDNVAFPLREHTEEVARPRSGDIVTEKLDMVGLDRRRGQAARRDLRRYAQAGRAGPRAGARPGDHPVRRARLRPRPGAHRVPQPAIIDLNQQIDATFLIVTHDINTARTVPDNIGLLYHGHLAMFGPREMLLSSEEPVVRQFLNAQRVGPIGMAEEKDADELEAEQRRWSLPPLPPIPLQLSRPTASPRASQRAPGQLVPRERRHAAAGLVPRQQRGHGAPAA